MVFSKFRAIFPTIIFILVSVVISMIVLNFFQVDMNDNNGFKVLKRVLTVEGMKNKKKINKKEGMCSGKHKKEGMCNSGRHIEGMCGSMEGMCTLEGMKNEEEEEEEEENELATIGEFASNLMD